MSTKQITHAVQYWRYPDLTARRIVQNRMTLRRWILSLGFPKPVQLGPNTIAWIASEVEEWLAKRAAARDRAAE